MLLLNNLYPMEETMAASVALGNAQVYNQKESCLSASSKWENRQVTRLDLPHFGYGPDGFKDFNTALGVVIVAALIFGAVVGVAVVSAATGSFGLMTGLGKIVIGTGVCIVAMNLFSNCCRCST